MAGERPPIRQKEQVIRCFSSEALDGEFIPWGLGDTGRQSWLKLAREEEVGFLYAGVGGVLEAEVQRSLMRLVNEGWKIVGEVDVSYDGASEPGEEGLEAPEPCSLEIGSGLLPLVDPFQQSPLLDRLRDVRRELSADIGFVVPGVKVQDDLALPPSGYRIRLRGTVAAAGEIFLDRFLAVGSLEQLGRLTGWTTTDPSYRLPAKWIEPSEREAAEGAGCMLLGGLSVLVTHLREVIRLHASEMLGLQDTHRLLARLRHKHPIVVEEFLESIGRVRKVRHVLRRLLDEGVSIRDLVTILETLGDHPEALDGPEQATELVRRALARQIVTSFMDEEGTVRALVLSDAVEERLLGDHGVMGLAEDLVRAVRSALEEHQHPPVLFANPALRPQVRRILAPVFPHLAVLSLLEIPRGVHIEVRGQVDVKSATPAEAPPPAAPAPPDAEGEASEEAAASGFWRSRKRKKE